MKLEFKKIDKSNYLDCINLKLSKKQGKFVASNLFSLVQASFEPDLYTLAIYDEGIIKGFILYDYDEDLKGWSMSRFMIDLKYQNSGIGRQALEDFLIFFKNKYQVDRIYTSSDVKNSIAIKLYESFGFEKQEKFEYSVNGIIYKEVRMLKLF